MTIITISRGTYSGGRDLAECLAKKLQIPCISREVLVEAAKSFGVLEQTLAEAVSKPPGFFERLSHQREAYMAFIRAALCQHAVQGSFVYHGHAGHLLIPDLPAVVRIRIVAPLEYRITAAVERMGLSRKEAIHHIEKVDKYREKWTQFLYGEQWGEPALFDLVINLEHLSISEACHLVCELVKLERYTFTDHIHQQLEDFALSSLIVAELAKDERTRGLVLDVEANTGNVTIQGRIQHQEYEHIVTAIAQEVPGVKSMVCNLATPSELPG